MPTDAPLARAWSNTNWLPGGRVLCGEYPGYTSPSEAARKLKALARFGVSTYIDLTTADEALKPYTPVALGVEVDRKLGDPYMLEYPVAKREVHHFPIRDLGVPDEALMTQILDTIDDALACARTVYIHCLGGVGRTGTVAGCWLRRHGAQPDEALDIIADRWKAMSKRRRAPVSPETSQQRRYVREWKERLTARTRFPVLARERCLRGALLGGAVGDALGAPVEFMPLDGIREQFGEQGIVDFVPGMWPAGSITDDTQMSLFTAEAMIRFEARGYSRGFASHKDVGYCAYRRWLHT